MRNTFPSPYTLADAEKWMTIATSQTPNLHYAIIAIVPDDVTGGEKEVFAGGIGLKEFTDINAASKEIGYWLGQDHWGRGLATLVVKDFSRWAFETFSDLVRLEAGVFAKNEASAKVLTKAGYTFEGTRRSAITKNGFVTDEKLFSLLRHECIGEELAKQP